MPSWFRWELIDSDSRYKTRRCDQLITHKHHFYTLDEPQKTKTTWSNDWANFSFLLLFRTKCAFLYLYLYQLMFNDFFLRITLLIYGLSYNLRIFRWYLCSIFILNVGEFLSMDKKSTKLNILLLRWPRLTMKNSFPSLFSKISQGHLQYTKMKQSIISREMELDFPNNSYLTEQLSTLRSPPIFDICIISKMIWYYSFIIDHLILLFYHFIFLLVLYISLVLHIPSCADCVRSPIPILRVTLWDIA